MSGTTQLAQPTHRRLVVMFDGTWNARSSLTNVSRMFEAIDDSKVVPGGKLVQLVKYVPGVGTRAVGTLSGGAFGYGLSENVEIGYSWLSEIYKPGDEIFVFGFSRGAYSARSLVSLVHRCGGVLKYLKDLPKKFDEKKNVTKDYSTYLGVLKNVVEDAYAMYHAYGETTDDKGIEKLDHSFAAAYKMKKQAFENSLDKNSFTTHSVTVKMLGVWDTVGALGIPDSHWEFLDDRNPLSNKHFGFHDQNLSCIVENAYHALAIDEHRWNFAPTLWSSQAPDNKEVKQVWFTGSHCNVGGGAGIEGDDPDDLWQYSYVWMQENARKHGLRFYFTYKSSGTQSWNTTTEQYERRVSRTELENSHAHFLEIPGVKFDVYKLFRDPFYREVNESNGAKLHWSVKERILQDTTYRPVNLIGTDGLQRSLKLHRELEGDKVTKHEKENLLSDETLKSLKLTFEVSCKGPEEIEVQFEINGDPCLKSWQIEDEKTWKIADDADEVVRTHPSEDGSVKVPKPVDLSESRQPPARTCSCAHHDDDIEAPGADTHPGGAWGLLHTGLHMVGLE